MSNLRSKSYGDRIQEQGLDTLEERRKRGDLLMAYRVFSGKDNMDPSTWFKNFGPGEGVVTRRQGGHLNVDCGTSKKLCVIIGTRFVMIVCTLKYF